MDNFPSHILPQLATFVKEPPSGGSWLQEIKLDGYRLLCRRVGLHVDFFTRRGHRWSHKFPSLATAVKALPCDKAWLDGELVVMIGEGRSCYGTLQEAVTNLDQGCLAYYVFDLLYLDGQDLCRVPLEIRKERLLKLIGEGMWNLQYVDHVVGSGPEFFDAACALRLEGIVSKQLGSIYQPEKRSPDWLKVKCRDFHQHRFVRWEWWKDR